MTRERTKQRAAAFCSVLMVGLAFLAIGMPACTGDEPQSVRVAAVAGSFYPDSPETLRATVTELLRDARPSVSTESGALPLRAIVVPHAGYVYSAATAACAYKLLEGTEPPDRVVLLGPNHNPPQLLGACSVADFSSYETPLGRLTVDGDARAKLLEHEPFHAMKIPHAREHCLEVQLPFIQALWPEPPPIVPILVGELSPGQSRAAAAGLAGIVTDRTLLVVSTDFTHYGNRFDFAPFGVRSGERLKERIRELDMGAVKLMEAVDPTGFRTYVAREAPRICGRRAVEVMLHLFARSEGSRPTFLRWTNSGDTTGSYSDCVSYVAMAVYAPAGPLEPSAAEAGPSAGMGALAADDKRALLRLARQSIEQATRGERVRAPDAEDLPEGLRADGAAFVTLTERGRLRGCIGHTVANMPLGACVTQVAVLAALRDPRFPPVGAEQVDGLRIEISVLTPLEVVTDTDDIRVGRDGLVVERGRSRGLLLPQVATEYGWTVETFLQQTCRKAGLPGDAWKEDDVTIYRFRAEVFNEDDFKD